MDETTSVYSTQSSHLEEDVIGSFKRSAVALKELQKHTMFSIEDEVIDGTSEALEYTVEVSEECPED